MRSFFQSVQQNLAASRQRRASEQFSKDLGRYITGPGKMFTLGTMSIKPTDLRFMVPERLVMSPVPDHYGVAEVFIPCTIGTVECTPERPLFWLHVKTVDTMICAAFITETRPYAEPADRAPLADLTDAEPTAGDTPR